MKNKLYYLGTVSLMLITTGSVFKIFHFAGAGILLFSGFVLFCLLFMPLAFRSSYRHEQNERLKYMYLLTFLIFFLDFAGALFKIMHWPGTSWLILASLVLVFLVLLPVYVFYNRNDKEINYNNFIAVLLFFAWFAAVSALLTVNVSKNIIVATCNSSSNLDDQAELWSDYEAFIRQYTAKAHQYDQSVVDQSEPIINSVNQIIRQLATIKDYPEEKSEKMDYFKILNKESRINSEGVANQLIDLIPAVMQYREQLIQSGISKDQVETINHLLFISEGGKEQWVNCINNCPVIFVIQQLNALKYKIQIAQGIACGEE
jgi:hypothetical protein